MNLLESILSAYDVLFNTNEEYAYSSAISQAINSEQCILNAISVLTLCKEKHIRIQNYYEEIIGSYCENDFYRHFRMSSSTFQKLLKLIEERNPNCSKINRGGFIPISSEKCLLITLWYLGKGDTIISLSDRFNVTESKVHSLLEEYIGYIAALADDLIKWPDDLRKKNIETAFANLKGYPGVIGAIDCTHISCVVPENQQSSYVNRKTLHTIILQGTCDADRVFTNIYVGFPGSAHDSRVLTNSSFMTGNVVEHFCNYKYHLLGDSAYPLKPWLITPYRDTGKLTNKEKNHNYLHSATRVAIENAFGILKGRWRILHFVNVYDIKKVVNIVVACCVLHNFCLKSKDNWEEISAENDDKNNENQRSRPDLPAVEKRLEITNFLSQ